MVNHADVHACVRDPRRPHACTPTQPTRNRSFCHMPGPAPLSYIFLTAQPPYDNAWSILSHEALARSLLVSS